MIRIDGSGLAAGPAAAWSPQSDAVRRAADEWYEYPGSVAERKSPYWVARCGHTVVTQFQDMGVETVELDSVQAARAAFAEATFDPYGPGAPQPGDVIRVLWGSDDDRLVTVVSASVHRNDWIYFKVVDDCGRLRVLLFGQYEIVCRPVAGAAGGAAECRGAA